MSKTHKGRWTAEQRRQAAAVRIEVTLELPEDAEEIEVKVNRPGFFRRWWRR